MAFETMIKYDPTGMFLFLLVMATVLGVVFVFWLANALSVAIEKRALSQDETWEENFHLAADNNDLTLSIENARWTSLIEEATQEQREAMLYCSLLAANLDKAFANTFVFNRVSWSPQVQKAVVQHQLVKVAIG